MWVLAGAACGTLVCGAALAQGALGTGSALNRNLSQGQGQGQGGSTSAVQPNAGIQRPSIATQVKLNNAIVTGNSAGGTQFRGSVGYSGALDFRGHTGSDDLFSFQREAFASGAAYSNVRGIGGLQEQVGLPTNALPSALANSTVLQRESSGVSGGEISGHSQTQPAINASTFKPGGLRSLSKYTSDSATEPMTFPGKNAKTGQDTGASLGASSLRGLYTIPPATGAPPAADNSTTPPPPRPGAAASNKISAPAESEPATGKIETESTYQRLVKQLEDGRPGNARSEGVTTTAKETEKPEDRPQWVRPPEPADAKANAGAGTPTQPATDTAKTVDPNAPKKPGEPDKPGAEEVDEQGLTFQQRLEKLRQKLVNGGNASDDADKRAAMDKAIAGEGKNAKGETKEEAERNAEDQKAKRDTTDVRKQVRELFGGEAPTVQKFVDPSKDPKAYERNMLAGQRALSDGKWFDAEEAFTKAILARGDDPMPAVGRLHAQIGGGMFLSAAINARALLRSHPELAAVKYDKALLPRADRLEKVLESLRDAATREDAFGRDCALLLAYLGHQTGSQADVEMGLGAVERIETRLDIPRDPLIDALRAMWLPGAP